ncbi:MAG: aspartate aminotransferase family protein [Chloroflexaceae bacterium]|nr:aspartate aminotransferase family protein [Chloroflexaceae bacterium]
MPGERTRTAIEHEQTYIFQTYPRPDFVLERGEGACLFDTEGQSYLDFAGGIAVNALGHGDAEICKTIAEQSCKLIHVSNLYHTVPGGELAKMLIERSPGLDRVFFCNSGTEGVEGAIKFARKFARERVGEGKTSIVAFEGSFHGRTMGAVALSSREHFRLPFMPVMPGVRFAPLNDIEALQQVMADDVCAVFVEPVQGEGGVNVADQAFLQEVRRLCDHHGALMVLDEIQCGMGRTGTLWAYEQYAVQPDMMVLAKPLAGGLPIGAILARQEVADAIRPGDHGTTFGGGPLITAVAQVVLRRISHPDFLAHVQHVGSYLEEHLNYLTHYYPERIRAIRGRGLMRGIHIRGSAAELRAAGHQVGLLMATAGPDVLRLLPPLIIEQWHVDELINRLRKIL